MVSLDAEFLAEVGLARLPERLRPAMLKHIYDTLEMRVGTQLASDMDDDELDEFQSYMDKNDQDGALLWLQAHRPNYKQVVAENLDRLRADIRQVVPQILRDEGIDAEATGN